MTRVSVLIPAYRAETYIARAVRSVLVQTMQEFEIIIGVDDGQDYLAILDGQGVRDDRIGTKSTGGMGAGSSRARNVAHAAAQGQYIAMLDADDAWMPAHLEQMLPQVASHGLAISQVDFRGHDSDVSLPNRTKAFAEGPLTLDEVLLACLHTYNPVIYDREKITHHWQESVPLLTDAVFMAEAFCTVPAVWYKPAPTYIYYHRNDSVCNAAEAADRFLAAGKIILDLLEKGVIASNPQSARIIRAYIARNDSLEITFKKLLETGYVENYQDFLGKNLKALHAPLL